MLHAFPRRQWLRECSSVIRHTYIPCLVIINLPIIVSNYEKQNQQKYVRLLYQLHSLLHVPATYCGHFQGGVL
jgi:hypothetical protein